VAQTETVGPMNLGNPGEFTMLQLAELTLKLVGAIQDRSQAATVRRSPSSAGPTSRSEEGLEVGTEGAVGRGFTAHDRLLPRTSLRVEKPRLSDSAALRLSPIVIWPSPGRAYGLVPFMLDFLLKPFSGRHYKKFLEKWPSDSRGHITNSRCPISR